MFLNDLLNRYLSLTRLIKIKELNVQIIEECFDQEDILRDFATKSEEC